MNDVYSCFTCVIDCGSTSCILCYITKLILNCSSTVILNCIATDCSRTITTSYGTNVSLVIHRYIILPVNGSCTTCVLCYIRFVCYCNVLVVNLCSSTNNMQVLSIISNGCCPSANTLSLSTQYFIPGNTTNDVVSHLNVKRVTSVSSVCISTSTVPNVCVTAEGCLAGSRQCTERRVTVSHCITRHVDEETSTVINSIVIGWVNLLVVHVLSTVNLVVLRCEVSSDLVKLEHKL